MQKDPADRYHSADALAKDLQRFMRGKVVRARRSWPLAATARLSMYGGYAVLGWVLLNTALVMTFGWSRTFETIEYFRTRALAAVHGVDSIANDWEIPNELARRTRFWQRRFSRTQGFYERGLPCRRLVQFRCKSLFKRIIRNAYPPIYDTDFTVRAETMSPEHRHILSLLYLARIGFLLSLSTLVLIWLTRLSPDLVTSFARPLVIQSLASAVLHAVFLRGWQDFAPKLFVIALIVGFMVAVANHDLIPAAGCILLHALVLLLVTADSPAATLRRAVLLITCYAAAVCVADPAMRPHFLVLPIPAAAICVSFFSWVLTKNTLRWMVSSRANSSGTTAAQRDPTRHDVDKESSAIRVRTAWLIAGGLIASFCWSAAPLYFQIGYVQAHGHPWQQLIQLAFFLGCLLAIHCGNWLFAEIFFHRRRPILASCVRSWYVAWRCLTVWIAYAPVLRAPAVFSFPQPWASQTLRLFVLNLSLVLAAAVPIGIAWDWVWNATYEPQPPPQKTFQPAFQTPVDAGPQTGSSFRADFPITNTPPDRLPESRGSRLSNATVDGSATGGLFPLVDYRVALH